MKVSIFNYYNMEAIHQGKRSGYSEETLQVKYELESLTSVWK